MSQVRSQIGQNIQLVPQILDQYELQRPKKVAFLDEATAQVFVKYQSDEAERNTLSSVSKNLKKDVIRLNEASLELIDAKKNEDFHKKLSLICVAIASTLIAAAVLATIFLPPVALLCTLLGVWGAMSIGGVAASGFVGNLEGAEGIGYINAITAGIYGLVEYVLYAFRGASMLEKEIGGLNEKIDEGNKGIQDYMKRHYDTVSDTMKVDLKKMESDCSVIEASIKDVTSGSVQQGRLQEIQKELKENIGKLRDTIFYGFLAKMSEI